VLSVVEPTTCGWPVAAAPGRQERDRRGGAQAIVRRARAGSRDLLIWEGDPAESILEASRSEGDLIVLGSRARTNLGG
jgi:nucleotide-binding universal stress UspA family protein